MKVRLGYRPRHKHNRSLISIAAGGALIAAAVPTALLAATPAADAAVCPSPPVKCFRADLTPSSFVSGSTQQLTLKVTNESGGQSLGSANVTAPTGYTITSLGTPSAGTATLSGNQIQLRTMNLSTGGSDVVTFTVQSPSSTSTRAWTATAKQSNDYNGMGNDFVLDPASGLTTSTVAGASSSGSPTPGCPVADVSCGKNFIRYDQASSVSTGTAVNASVWFIGRMDFPATSVSGGQLYSMEAPSQPANFCPVNGSPTACTFEMDIDTVPAPYDANHAATLTLTCDSSHCTAGAVFLLFKQDETGTVSPIVMCPLNVLGDPCYSVSTNGDGDTVITVQNITAGDPRIGGIEIP